MERWPLRTARLQVAPIPMTQMEGHWYQDDLKVIYGDEEVQRYISTVGLQATSEYVCAMINESDEEWKKHSYGTFLCVEPIENCCVGFVRLQPSHIDGEHHEIVYAMHPAFQGKKFAQEAISAVLQSEFKHGRDTLIATIYPDNAASRHILKKQGFTRGKDNPYCDEVEEVWYCDLQSFKPYTADTTKS